METINKLQNAWDYTLTTCSALLNGFVIKCVGAFALFVLHFSFGTIGFKILNGVILLIIMDTITGIIASYKEGTVISSKRFFDSVVKLLLFPMIIASASITETAIGLPILTISYIVASYLLVHEFLSIIENFGRIGYNIPNKLLNRQMLLDLINKK